jgi:hypothetical protein
MSEAQRVQHCRSLAMSGKSVDWVSVLPNGWTVRRLVASTISDRTIKFRARAQVKMLPSDGNLVRWRKIPAGVRRCSLIGATGQPCGQAQPSMEHVLAGCPAALHQGRITWRHNSVLLVLKHHLVRHICAVNAGRVRFSRPNVLRFRSETGTWWNNGDDAARLKPFTLRDYLAERSARDWRLTFDLPGHDNFTHHHFPWETGIHTSKRPDIVLWSQAVRVVVCFELTVPSEERVMHWHAEKARRYRELEDAAADGWRLEVRPLEVGYLGNIAYSMEKQLRAFGLSQQKRRIIRQELEETAAECSAVLFECRHDPTWNGRSLLAVARPSTAGHTHDD